MSKRLILAAAMATVLAFCLTAQNLMIPKCGAAGKHEVKVYSGFTLCYRRDLNVPEWVAYTLTKEQADSALVKRTDNFRADISLGTCTPDDYRLEYGSAFSDRKISYDKGHMCPAKDCAYSIQAMYDCFYMSNMRPQNPYLNQRGWRLLEKETDYLAGKYGAVIAETGPIFMHSVPEKYIGRNRDVAVPDAFYKIYLVKSGNGYKAWSWIMPNAETDIYSTDVFLVNSYKFETTIDSIEKLTGLDFFSDLPDDTENALESAKSDYSHTR